MMMDCILCISLAILIVWSVVGGVWRSLMYSDFDLKTFTDIKEHYGLSWSQLVIMAMGFGPFYLLIWLPCSLVARYTYKKLQKIWELLGEIG